MFRIFSRTDPKVPKLADSAVTLEWFCNTNLELVFLKKTIFGTHPMVFSSFLFMHSEITPSRL